MAKKPAKKIAQKKRKVKKKKRLYDVIQKSSKRKKKKKAKKKRKKVPPRGTPSRKPRKKKRKPDAQKIKDTIAMIRRHPELFPDFVIPRKKVPLSEYQNLEMMAEQVAQRIQEKIIGPGFTVESTETKIMSALIAAEQAGDINEQYYVQADLYGWTPQEVYQLWIYH